MNLDSLAPPNAYSRAQSAGKPCLKQSKVKKQRTNIYTAHKQKGIRQKINIPGGIEEKQVIRGGQLEEGLGGGGIAQAFSQPAVMVESVTFGKPLDG